MIGIYKIISPSNKIYIGQSININKRFYQYKNLHCKLQIILYNSFQKYGVNNHKFEIIETCSINELNEKERYWQEYYNSLTPNGLNCKLTETSLKRRKLSEGFIIKLSNQNKGSKNPMFGKKGILHPNYNKILSQEIKDKISLGLKGLKNNSKKVIDIKTNKIYKTLKDACKDLNISYTGACNKLSKKYNSKKPTKQFNLKFLKEMNELNFGIPLRRQKKEEKYSFPVLTMQAEPTLKKGARRFILNKSAFDLLGLNSDKAVNETLSVGFPQQNNGNFIIAVTTNDANIPDKFKYMVHKTENSFSDLVLYNAIQRELSLDNTNDVDFILEKSNDVVTFKVYNEDTSKPTIATESGTEFREKEDVSQKEEEIITVEAEEENALTLN